MSRLFQFTLLPVYRKKILRCGFTMDKLSAVCEVVLVLLVAQTDAQLCSSHTNCTECLLHACNWCREPVNGGSPRCMDKTELSQGCNNHVPIGMSGIRILENRPDLLAAPQKMRMNIEYGTPFVVDFDIRVPRYVGVKNKLLVKYKDIKEYNQTLVAQENKSRSFKKRSGNYFLMKNLEADSTIKLLYNVSATSCGKIKNKRATLVFRFIEKGKKVLKEKIKVLLRKLACPCDCPVEYHEVDSPRCSGNGNLECGVCNCRAGYMGRSCEQPLSVISEMEMRCIDPNGTKVCSGRGECIEGFCDCHTRRRGSAQRYSGEFCQCDDYSCSYHKGRICGGQGICTCGNCRCYEGYTGEACDCPTSVATCMTSDGTVCNGVGECECGVCRCDPSTLYKGPTCEECPTCPGKCRMIKPCAQCMVFSTGPFTDEECFERCEQYNIMRVDEIGPNLQEDERLCQFRDEDDCIFKFTYRYTYGQYMTVEVTHIKECPKLFGLVLPVDG